MYIGAMRKQQDVRFQGGFTLYELLITVSIVGVILTFGLTNLGEFNRSGRMVATANDLHASFHLARSEAARAKQNVSICASANPMNDNPDCGGGFTGGWIVFVDVDGDVVRDPEDIVLRRHPARDSTISIDTPGADDYFAFGASGLGRGNVTGNEPMSTAVICDARGNEVAAGGRSSARVVVVTPLGRAVILSEVGQIGDVINNTGASCG